MRIVRWQIKAVYVVASYFVLILLVSVLGFLRVDYVTSFAVAVFGLLLLVIIAARIFRGEGEDLHGRREWWRMTSKRPMSMRVAIIIVIFFAFSVLTYVRSFGPKNAQAHGLALWQIIGFGILGALYFNSAFHLPKPVRFDREPTARVRALYKAYNERRVWAVLAQLHPRVEWPSGAGDEYLHGRRAVRLYWLKQWQEIDPNVRPQQVTVEPDGRIIAVVRQVVRDKQGNLINELVVQHEFHEKNGLIDRMEIHQLPAGYRAR